MSQPYSQVRAMLAITVASLRSTLKSPQAVFVGLFFPIVLIVIFGSIGGGGGSSVDVAFEKGTDSTTQVYQKLRHAEGLRIVPNNQPGKDIEEMLKKGRLTAILAIQKQPAGAPAPYQLQMRFTQASAKDLVVLRPVLRDAIHELETEVFTDRTEYVQIVPHFQPGREYKMIDFLLPGMIGFSLIGASIFSIAFVFFSMRETLVLKRLYSTPIRRGYIILGESLSRVIFQLLVVLVLIAFGYFFYHFTLANGIFTLLSMLFLSFLALLVFMGFGFFIASVARNQHVIPIYANLFMFPQYFLSGTFFSRDALPAFLQPVLKALPLTALNDSMRKVAFEGASLVTCWPEILILCAWGVVVYAATVRVFRWE
ncbi:ABC transporter permease [Flaviaesturariibacter aridisoli]|uniref:Transport permease protein n=1 Tax=Flaviaesturariibacter aridisoli TaxID=2545761 RepID=A0A4R4DY52_9BACT|nr:ABC transporter permease [Flaviaesturariibacter aridisoli]TCZ70146.1 ABC transporter permease [Flaviaesturariibacter aridisoli]